MGLALPVEGELSGTWGDTVNNGITNYLDVSLAGTQTISGSQTAVTLSLTNGNASGTNISQAGAGLTGSAQYAIINCTGNPASQLTITVPASSRQYLVLNSTSTSQSVKVVGVGPTTGVTIVSGERAHIAWNGSDFVKVASSLLSQLSGTVAVSAGGTGQTSYTDGQLLIGNSTGNTLAKATLTAGSGVTITNGSGAITIAATGSGGTVTSVGLSAPAFLSVSGSPVTGSGTLALSYSGTALPVANGGSGATSLTGVLKGNGTSAFTAATAGTDFVAPATATTFTATQTFSGSASTLAMVLNDAAETVTVSATAATGTINYDVTTQSVLYYTSNASGNWTLNVRGSSGTSLNTLMSTGQSITFAFLVTNGGTAYYQTGFQIDGSSVTPKWAGGTAPTAGNASSIDAYTITVIKTGSATFTALASQTKFA
jgi:hypothetical protein